MCLRPCIAPAGNWNAKRVTLCGREKCKHIRRMELQRARRKQMMLKITDTKRSKHRGPRKSAVGNYWGENEIHP
jgi:hypothetical protein